MHTAVHSRRNELDSLAVVRPVCVFFVLLVMMPLSVNSITPSARARKLQALNGTLHRVSMHWQARLATHR